MAAQIRREPLLLGALIAVQLVPIWTLSWFPSQDGPAHLAIANILREYGAPDGQVLREYFVLEPGAITNWFVYFLLAHVLRFLPTSISATEKLVKLLTLEGLASFDPGPATSATRQRSCSACWLSGLGRAAGSQSSRSSSRWSSWCPRTWGSAGSSSCA